MYKPRFRWNYQYNIWTYSKEFWQGKEPWRFNNISFKLYLWLNNKAIARLSNSNIECDNA